MGVRRTDVEVANPSRLQQRLIGALPESGQSEYPKPPFPRQLQPWPGLVSPMTPGPDHGETSYRGTGRLTVAL